MYEATDMGAKNQEVGHCGGQGQALHIKYYEKECQKNEDLTAKKNSIANPCSILLLQRTQATAC